MYSIVLYGILPVFFAYFHVNNSGIYPNRPEDHEFMCMHISIMNFNEKLGKTAVGRWERYLLRLGKVQCFGLLRVR